MGVFKPKDIAARFRVDVDTVYGWLKSGKLRGHHLGGRRSWDIEAADLEAFISSSEFGHEAGHKGSRKPRKLAANHGGQRKKKAGNENWMEQYP